MADLTELRNQIRVRAYYAVSAAAPDLQAWLRNTSPRDTGLLISKTTVSPRALEATVKAATKYASFLRDGTRPHTIRPRKGRVLSFYWPKVGRQMFLTKVNHPGTRPNSWWDNGIRQWPRMLEAALRRAPN